MRLQRLSAPVSLALALTACGGADDPQPGVDPDVLAFETGAFTVPTGESFECFYTDITTDRELSVVSASARQGPGGHHLTLYYVDNPRPVGHSPCNGNAEMVDWHFVVGAGGEGNQIDGIVKLAEGLAIKVPAGKQIMVQTHYINTTGEERQENNYVEARLVDPAEVKAYASDFVVDDDQFQIEPSSSLEVTSVCAVPRDTSLTMLLGHMHEHGVRYKLETVDEAGGTLDVLIDEMWRPEYASHPPVLNFTMEEPLVLKGGTRLRQTCSWNNNTAAPLLFPTEMCIAFGYYFPGESRVDCERVGDPGAP
jgi:hypothetical protein